MTAIDTALLGLVGLLALGDPGIEFTSSGWYRLEFKDGQRLTLKVLDEAEDSFHCRYQGVAMKIPGHRIKSLSTLAAAANPGDPDALAPAREARIRDSVEALASLDREMFLRAYGYLVKELPDCRDVLHEALLHRQAGVRKLVVKLLGEFGEAEKDLGAVTPLLKDSNEGVRVVAVLAVRRLGSEAMSSLVDYLRWEPVANNRKLAVKTLQRWQDLRAAETLVNLLEREKDRGVRVYIVQALRSLLGTDLGQTPGAWRRYLLALYDNDESVRFLERKGTQK